MTLLVRDQKTDVVIAAGPRVTQWPSHGIRVLSKLMADYGLTVGWLGGDDLEVKGIVPLPGSGGMLIAQDQQRRIHRLSARAVVRICAQEELPEPFPGWRSQGLIPISSALFLSNTAELRWEPSTVILGSGNRALRFASGLLERGYRHVYCVESRAQWGAKRYAGWEVERRRFEMLGGKLIEGKPLSLVQKGAMLWEFKLEDMQGIRMMDVARVVACGPYQDIPNFREYPPGSMLFELVQTAPLSESLDIEGWYTEEQRARSLAVKIIKSLVPDLGDLKESLEKEVKRARIRSRRIGLHREKPFSPGYQGKWTLTVDSKWVRSHVGVPKGEQEQKRVASVECFEEIGCNLCERACPEEAIVPFEKRLRMLDPAKCTACGICLEVCPSSATLMMFERPNQSMSEVVFPWRGESLWKKGDFAQLVNRRGDVLGNGRILEIVPSASIPPLTQVQLVRVEVPSHLVWEARGIRKARSQNEAHQEQVQVKAMSRSLENERVEVTINGERRLVRDKVSVSVALFETGLARAEDILLCRDGSCGLCQLDVDGVKKLACQSSTHRGMAIKATGLTQEQDLCPCLGISRQSVEDRIRQGHLKEPGAIVAATHVGQGKCHGQLCRENFRRFIQGLGVPAENWVDWSFPWSDWAF